MTTKRDEIANRMAAENRLVAAGILSPRDTSQDAEWEVAWMKRLEQERLRTLPERSEQKSKTPTGK
jgi:hypothetical protein